MLTAYVLAALASGSLTALPPGTDPSPLLLVLHGDGETAAAMATAWGPAAKKRGVAVVALQCPKSEGCSAQSWWKWNGDPAWLLDQTRAVAELRPIDTERMWLVGWSGGGSYIGYRTQELERSFAALVVHGGGIPPALGTCPEVRAPVYFLVGDGNPLHQLAVRLRDHYEGCGNEVVWTLLPGASHEDERRALARHREAILDWLSTKRLASRVEPDAAAMTPRCGPSSGTLASSPEAASPAQAPSASSTDAPRPSCRCGVGGDSGAASPGAAVAALLALLPFARRCRCGRKPSTHYVRERGPRRTRGVPRVQARARRSSLVLVAVKGARGLRNRRSARWERTFMLECPPSDVYGKWGYVPAVDLNTPNQFDANPSLFNLARCDQ